MCMYVLEGGGERQKESGAGSRVKGSAAPGGARGSQWQSGGREGVVSDALIETSDMTKTGLTGRLNGAAVTEQLSSASHTYTSLSAAVTPSAPFFLIHAISLLLH